MLQVLSSYDYLRPSIYDASLAHRLVSRWMVWSMVDIDALGCVDFVEVVWGLVAGLSHASGALSP